MYPMFKHSFVKLSNNFCHKVLKLYIHNSKVSDIYLAMNSTYFPFAVANFDKCYTR